MQHASPVLHFAITSHGFGHLTRTLAVVQSLLELQPEVEVLLSTTADPAWIAAHLPRPVRVRHVDYEPGVAQRTCFEVDVAATRTAYAQFLEERPARLDAERKFLRDQGVTGVVSDVSALAIRAASDLDLPAIAVSNFTWDWILEPWWPEASSGADAAGDSAPRVLAADYATGTRLLRLPFGPDRSSLPASEPAPLVARLATREHTATRRALGLGSEAFALVCPGGWGAEGWPSIDVQAGTPTLVTVGDLPIRCEGPLVALGHALPDGFKLPDLVAAADVVLGKPGYGMASECRVNRTPFLMTERPDFRETPVLVEEFERTGKSARCSLDAFFAGEWAAPLAQAIEDPTPWAEPEPDAARRVAARLAELLLG